MRKLAAAAVLVCGGAGSGFGQGRPIDWPSFGGDAQRSGFEKSDSRITKDNVKDFKLVLKHKLGSGTAGSNALTPPVVIGLLISYRGFKELAFVTNGEGDLWALDADMDRVFWQKHIGPPAAKRKHASAACAAAPTAIPALQPPMNFAGRRRPAARKPAEAKPGSNRVGGSGFGESRSVFVLSTDGMLHQINSADGSDQFPPLAFVPAGAKASSLTLQDGIVYTTTSETCAGAPNAVWALNLNDAEPKPVSYALETAPGGPGGFAIGQDGTVYVQTAGALVALSPDLTPKKTFATPGSGAATPVAFVWKDKELVVTSGKQGSLLLLDPQDEHGAALYQTSPLAAGNVWGGLSSWEDADGTRWVAAPVWGPVSPELQSFAGNGAAPNGSLAAFKLEEHDGRPTLTPGWVSRDLMAPVPPVITAGTVFTVSTGASRKGKGHATLYALDGATGKEIYSTADQVNARANLTGMTVVNGRVYFTTADGTLYAFGVPMER